LSFALLPQDTNVRIALLPGLRSRRNTTKHHAGVIATRANGIAYWSELLPDIGACRGVNTVLPMAGTSFFNTGRSMFGLAADHRLPHPAGGLLSYLRSLESAPDRLRPRQAETLSDTIAEGLTDIAERLQRRATRTGSEANRLGGQLAAAGRDTVTLFSKEVSTNPMIAVGAALGVGMIVGLALFGATRGQRRAPGRRRRVPARKSRRGSRA
jgi:ElaB/YqjD/DUF883 family membrane-anchored ribosome-binding protein